MTEQSKLMQQVEEIRRRAHVCGNCRGAGKTIYAMTIPMPDGEYKRGSLSEPCCICHGTGQVPALDIDALCSALVTLAQAVEAREEASKAGCAFAEKHRQYRRDGQPPAMEAELDELCASSEETRKRVVETHAAALALLRDGMQHGEP